MCAGYNPETGMDLDNALDNVIRAFGTGSTFRDWSPYVLGDEVARRIGAEPVGIPHMGGYAVGRRIVERYLAATGLEAAHAIVPPVHELLEAVAVTPPPVA